MDALVAGLQGETVSTSSQPTPTPTTRRPAGCSRKKPARRLTVSGPTAPVSGGAAERGVDREFIPDNILGDGGVLSALDWHLRAIHTPGHCSNHICLALPEENTLFCGDQLMAWSTTVILPPDGSVTDYLASLEVLKKRPETIYRPTHGAAIEKPHAHIEQVIAHRLHRIEQVFDAVASGLGDIPSMRARIYHGLDRALNAGAELSILGSLYYLVEQGRVIADSERAVYHPAD